MTAHTHTVLNNIIKAVSLPAIVIGTPLALVSTLKNRLPTILVNFIGIILFIIMAFLWIWLVYDLHILGEK